MPEKKEKKEKKVEVKKSQEKGLYAKGNFKCNSVAKAKDEKISDAELSAMKKGKTEKESNNIDHLIYKVQ